VKGQINLTSFDVGLLNQGAMTVLPNERVLLAQPGVSPNWDVACYLPKGGTLAADFGTAGVIETPFLRSVGDEPRGIHLRALPSGGVLIAGATAQGFALGRWDHNGVLDATFGTDGLTEIENGLEVGDVVNGLTMDAVNGQILIGGATLTAATGEESDAFAARFLPDPVMIRITDPRAAPVPARDRRSASQKFTVVNRTLEDQDEVKVRLYALPANVNVRDAIRLPGIGNWELVTPLSLASGAALQFTATYFTTPVLRGRTKVSPPIPAFIPLVEALVSTPR
jgi:hypothetical protein